jgi:predicted GNAT superfamily acetyltransferase
MSTHAAPPLDTPINTIVRHISDPTRMRDCVELQKEVWGFDDADLLPVRMLVVASKVGGQVFGAYDGDRLAGFLAAIPGVKPSGEVYLHSHMLGVRDEYRNSGVGKQLKHEQRRDAIDRGFMLVEWTFDPLELKNAYFNIERLGAVVRRFTLNQYGFTSNRFDTGLPSDRCTAEWWVSSRRARAVASGASNRPWPTVDARIAVPVEVALLRELDSPKAREVQHRVSQQFLEHFSKGLAVIGFERTETHGVYLLGEWEGAA